LKAKDVEAENFDPPEKKVEITAYNTRLLARLWCKKASIHSHGISENQPP
jgi:hypothetical protein